jgi:hypothetical protein
MTEGMASGEDIAFGLEVWFSGESIAFGRREPAYLVHGDADGRVTIAPRPVRDDLAPLAALRAGALIPRLTDEARTAILVKLIRVHVFGAIANRPDPSSWRPDDGAALREESEALHALAPQSERVFSLTDRRLLEAIASSAPPSTLVSLARLRLRRTDARNLLTRDPSGLLAREGPLRFAAASFLRSR